ncbi:MAG: sigma-70 family RNA polymerase sigma factor [Saprospiraceae bacterium]|nr:sigma-70 family RNA polymerase sigma factor [Saprospiraceae bacterium]
MDDHLITKKSNLTNLKEHLIHIVEKCRKDNPKAQKELYDLYAPLFMSIAMRYMKKRELAEDVMVMGFYKIFSKIDKFKGEGSFEGWMKRIIVNEALMQIRKHNNLYMTLELKDIDKAESSSVLDDLAYEDLLALLDELPPGYRTIFNMYVIEGYKHREIAELLDISINTSKSQLILAKKRMRELFKKKGFNQSMIS